jgi:hypothetical protein
VPLTPKSPWSPPLPKWELAMGCRAKSCRECEGVPQIIINTTASLAHCSADTRRSHAARRAMIDPPDRAYHGQASLRPYRPCGACQRERWAQPTLHWIPAPRLHEDKLRGNENRGAAECCRGSGCPRDFPSFFPQEESFPGGPGHFLARVWGCAPITRIFLFSPMIGGQGVETDYLDDGGFHFSLPAVQFSSRR